MLMLALHSAGVITLPLGKRLSDSSTALQVIIPYDCYEVICWSLFNILRDEHRMFSKEHHWNGMLWQDKSGFLDKAFKCSTLCYLVCCLLHANLHLLSTACMVSTTFMHLFQICYRMFIHCYAIFTK